MIALAGQEDCLAFKVRRGQGIGAGRDGYVYKHVLAAYTHLHAMRTTQWARGLVARARDYRQGGL